MPFFPISGGGGGGPTPWTDNGVKVFTTAPRDIDLQSKGLQDDNVTTPVLLGDVLNTTLDTTNQTLLGATNELFARVQLLDGYGSFVAYADPAVDAITVANVDDSYGAVITLTGAGNSQTLPDPTDVTRYHAFVVVNNDTSTDTIDVVGASTVTLDPGKAVKFLWDGDVWVASDSEGLWYDNGTHIQPQPTKGVNVASGQDYRVDGNAVLNETQVITDEVVLDTGVANPAHVEGVLFYDNTKKAVSYYNDNTNVTVNMGQEVLFLVENQTGALIPNGSVICPDSTTVITLADASVKDKSQLIAVVTHDIADGATGYATRLGQVGGVDTSGLTAGETIYLSATTPGAFTNVKPNDGSYITTVGVVDVVDPVNGIITVDPSTTQLTVEVTDTNGFPPSQRTGTTLTATAFTRIFEIAPTGSTFHFYQDGIKYEKDAADTVTWTNVEGEHWFYYDLGVLTHIANPTGPQKQDIVLTKCLVGYIYWNATDGEVTYDIYDERHGIGMAPATHVYLHLTRGAQYIRGYGVGNIVADDTGDDDTHAEFSIEAGEIFDEDLNHTSTDFNIGDTMDVAYLVGAGGNFRTDTQAGFAVLNAPAGRLYYNEWTGATWQLTEVGNNDFVLYHIFATNGVNKKLISVMGQNAYPTLGQARDGAATEIANITSGFEVIESVPIATIIFQTGDGYTNAVKARVRTTDTGEEYVDWRTTELSQGTPATSHANLTNIEQAGTGILNGHISDQAQAIYGAKSFQSDTTFGEIEIRKNGVTVDTDIVATVSAWGRDSNTNDTEYGNVEFSALVATDGSEEGQLDLSVQDGGTLTNKLTITGDNTTVKTTRVYLPAPNSATPDIGLSNSQWELWLDEANDEFELKAKKADGTVLNQTIGSGAAAGVDGSIQFATGGAMDSSADLFWDDGNSYLGIGTNTPGSALELVDTSNTALLTINNTTAGKSGIGFETSGTLQGAVGLSGAIEANTSSHMSIFAETGNDIVFFTNGQATRKVTINGNGDITTTGDVNIDGSFNTGSVAPGTGTPGALIRNGSSNASTLISVDTTSAIAPYKIMHLYGGQGQMLVRGDGDVEKRNNSYSGISDIRLKENIEPAGGYIVKLLKLQLKKFNFIGRDQPNLGLIAQEVEPIFPGLVKTGGGFEGDYDKDGNEIHDRKSIKYSVLNLMMLDAIQTLKKENDSKTQLISQQKESIDKQEKQIKRLENLSRTLIKHTQDLEIELKLKKRKKGFWANLFGR